MATATSLSSGRRAKPTVAVVGRYVIPALAPMRGTAATAPWRSLGGGLLRQVKRHP
jgi:hypothetical protein